MTDASGTRGFCHFYAVEAATAELLDYALVLRQERSYGGVRMGVKLHLDQLAVVPDCRSMGIGACLMDQALGQCGPHGNVVTF